MRHKVQQILLLILAGLSARFFLSCRHDIAESGGTDAAEIYYDIPFIQEYHEAFKVSNEQSGNEIRSIIADRKSNIWVATATGVFVKKSGMRDWEPVISGDERGPAYSVAVSSDGDVLMGTWNGIYRYANDQLKKEAGPEPPVSVISDDGSYAMGPKGIWRFEADKWERLEYKTGRTIRDAFADGKGSLWIATDAGLWLCRDGKTTLFQDTSELISCYVRAISPDASGNIWAGVMGGVSVRSGDRLLKNLTPENGIPSANVNCITLSPDSLMWVGTDVGVVRFAPDGSHSLRFSKRWLADNRVLDVAFDNEGTAWIATANGVSAIRRKAMTLAGKEKYFYGQLIRRHIREPWTCCIIRLDIPGDTSSWQFSDDDNDGEYTGGYLAMESFRYAVTKDEDAKIKARKAFEYLRFLHEVTGTEGFFARSVVPVSWTRVSDANRTFSKQQLAEELVSDPRYKPVEERWRKSKDGKWLWKGDTSSDEMDGHMMSFFYYYEYAAGDEEKQMIRDHVRKIIDCLIKNNFNLIDIDGTHSRWGVWSPDQLNRDPDWASEKYLNSFELLAYLKFAGHITGSEKYEKEYRRLIDREGYLENASHLNQKNPAWEIYFDRTMEGYLFPILLKYENDPNLLVFYKKLIVEWMNRQTSGENLINNMTYALATGNKVNIRQTIDFLKDTPLDLVDWTIDHTLREDVHIVRSPVLEEMQISELPPASIRSTVRWDKNPWAAIHGHPSMEREPVFWLWPYWMARYLGIIQTHNT